MNTDKVKLLAKGVCSAIQKPLATGGESSGEGGGMKAAFGDSFAWEQGDVLFIGFQPDQSDDREYNIETVKQVITKHLAPIMNLPVVFVPDGWSTRGPVKSANLIQLKATLSSDTEVVNEINKIAMDSSTYPNIRISFNPDTGAYSQLGKENLRVPATEETMNLGWLDEPSAWEGNDYGVIKHEFGHAIGLIHEHTRADHPLNLKNKQLLYDIFQVTQGWDPATVESNVVQPWAIDTLNSSVYDPDSIMHYRLDCNIFSAESGTVGCKDGKCKYCNLGRCTGNEPPGYICATKAGDVQNNNQLLSKLDIETIRNKYPIDDFIKDVHAMLLKQNGGSDDGTGSTGTTENKDTGTTDEVPYYIYVGSYDEESLDASYYIEAPYYIYNGNYDEPISVSHYVPTRPITKMWGLETPPVTTVISTIEKKSEPIGLIIIGSLVGVAILCIVLYFSFRKNRSGK
jgi:hypothetical protein